MSIEGDKVNRLLIDEVIILDGSQCFYGDIFKRCKLKLEAEAQPKFLMCVFENCSFDPPFIYDDQCSWKFLRFNSNQVLNSLGE